MLLPSAYLLFLSFLRLAFGYKELSDKALSAIPDPGSDFDINTGSILAPILKVRVAGTPEIERVRHHFVNYFKKILPKWQLIWENSTQPTALGRDVSFSNLILRRDPPWAKSGDVGRLVLAAHYDSKMEPTGFIGAVDSAAPCAMIMHAARSIDQALTQKWEDIQKSGKTGGSAAKGVELYLLDGEEAFYTWTDTDSVYGARSLASTLDRNVNPAMSIYRTQLNQISLFVLLDLLGSKEPTLPSYFPTTHWAYQHMAKVEKRLRALRQLKSSPNHISKRPKKGRQERMFLSDANKGVASVWYGGGIEDDHVPFMQKGVPVLHMIPSPFPDVWHTMNDDGPHLDMPTVEDWARIVTGFTAEWLELGDHMPKATNKPRSVPSRTEGFLEEDEWEQYDLDGWHDELSFV